MREKIKEVTVRLIVSKGYQGLSVRNIAQNLNISRANIYYHFGSKKKLVDEVIREYINVSIDVLDEIWKSNRSYSEKVLSSMEFNRQRYRNFNKSVRGGKPWALISRLRLETALLGDASCARLQDFSTQLERMVRHGVRQAQTASEIAADAPVDVITVQLTGIIETAGSITTEAGSFDGLEKFYRTHIRLVLDAYGVRQQASIMAAK
jgi:TetR/AcrR family transcriptional repressor of nem operon